MADTFIVASADRTLMHAENRVHRLFLRYVEESKLSADFFDPRNADDWVRAFGEWLVEQQAASARVRASND